MRRSTAHSRSTTWRSTSARRSRCCATPWIKDHWGWHAAFAVCCAGLVLGLVNFVLMRRTLIARRFRCRRAAGALAPRSAVPWAASRSARRRLFIVQHKTLAVACVVHRRRRRCSRIFVYMIVKGDASERAGLLAALVLIVAERAVLHLLPADVDVADAVRAAQRRSDVLAVRRRTLFTGRRRQFQALNPIWIMLLSPCSRSPTRGSRKTRPRHADRREVRARLRRRGGRLLRLRHQRPLLRSTGKVSSWFMVWGYGLYSLGELLVSGLGLAMIARYVPARMGGFMMGAYFVATGISQYLGERRRELRASALQ